MENNNMKQLITFFTVMTLSLSAAFAQSEVANPQVTVHTSRGDIRLELYAQEAPISVANFLQYANEGFYAGTVFHRVISHFMIQGGGLESSGNETVPQLMPKTTREPIVNEATNGLKNTRGTVAMARTNDVNSATSQFFINVELNGSLDHVNTENSRSWGYTVFGRVIEGMDVVDDIRFVETGANDVPIENVTIESVEVH
jgi:peptidyl-prolyl cis-trans isomerase B (cyclophilin B)